MPRKVENIIGKRFGRLVVIENLGFKKHGSTVHKCICDCGAFKEVPASYLKSNHTRSCGCWVKEIHTIHNLCKTRLYKIYEGMKKRCFGEYSKAYKDYGERGITICNEWLKDFKAFYDWAYANGYKDHLTIDRIDVNGNYEPSNCRWVDRKTQNSNTRRNKFITYNGETKTISDWGKQLKIPINTLSRRLKQNRPIGEIFYKGDLKCKKTK